jgi:FeS assembly SUF system protein
MENPKNKELEIIEALKNVFDPEMPVNVYDLGLIYKIDFNNGNVLIDMTLTAPNCPVVDNLIFDVENAIKSVEGVKSVDVKIVFDPPWSSEKLSDEAKLELGLL